MERADIILNLMAEQRNVALDQLVATRAELVMAAERVKELEAKVADLTPKAPPKDKRKSKSKPAPAVQAPIE